MIEAMGNKNCSKSKANRHHLLVYGFIRRINKQFPIVLAEETYKFYLIKIKKIMGYENQGGSAFEYMTQNKEPIYSIDFNYYHSNGQHLLMTKINGNDVDIGTVPSKQKYDENNSKLICKKNEYIHSCIVYYGGSFNSVKGLTFVLNNKKEIHFGSKNYTEKVIKPDDDQFKLIGFYGRRGWFIDQLGFIFSI
eukprot:257562_1